MLRRKRHLPIGTSHVGRGDITRVGYRSTAINSTSIVVDMPPGTVAGDLVLAVMYARNGIPSEVSAPGLTFTQVYRNTSATGVSVWWARAVDDTEPTVTFTTSANDVNLGAVIVFRGVEQVLNPIDGWETGVITAATTLIIPSLNCNTGMALALHLLGTSDDNTLTQSDPNWTTIASGNTSGTGAYLFAQHTLPVTGEAGSLAVTETTNGPDGGYYVSVALRRGQG